MVALQAPGVDKDLSPVLSDVNGESPATEINLGFGEIIWSRTRGIDNKESPLLANQDLLAIEREVVVTHILDQDFGFRVIVADRQALQIPGGIWTRLSRQPKEGVSVDSKTVEVACRNRDLA